MVTGQLPFRSGDAVYHHIHTPPPEAKSLDPAVSDELSNLILRCMQKDSASRFQNAKELLEALRKVRVE
jgi:serine/threonine-protein kinase